MEQGSIRGPVRHFLPLSQEHAPGVCAVNELGEAIFDFENRDGHRLLLACSSLLASIRRFERNRRSVLAAQTVDDTVYDDV
jgi:hypothetical protein